MPHRTFPFPRTKGLEIPAAVAFVLLRHRVTCLLTTATDVVHRATALACAVAGTACRSDGGLAAERLEGVSHDKGE